MSCQWYGFPSWAERYDAWVSMTTILASRYECLHHVRASHFDSCSSVYDWCYPVRLTLDAWKKRHLCCQHHCELEKNHCVCMCWVLPAPDVVSTIKEAPIGVERYDNDTNGSRAKDDREVFGRRVRPGASRYCDSVAGWNRWVIKWLERNENGETYQEPLKPLSCFPSVSSHTTSWCSR